MPPALRSFLFRVLVYLAFFASGAACLIAEVTWNRMLIVVVGNSLSATAMIIVVFMGGLGLGSYAGGRLLARRRASLLPYLLLETLIGLLVLLSPALFAGLARLFAALAEHTDAGAGLMLARLVVSALALLLPAFLMGATFPAIISGSAPAVGRALRSSYLYSVNTLGAALGTFAAGYHLLFEFGVRFTLAVACGLYAGAALAALAAYFLVGQRIDRAPSPAAAVAGSASVAARPRFLAAATFAIGFVALAYEVLLTRLGILFLGNSVSVFPLVLAGFLLGTGLSAWLGTWVYGKLRRRLALFGGVALAAGAAILITPYLLLSDRIVSAAHFARFADAELRNPLPILGAIVAPTILLGALLPIAMRMLQDREGGEATRSAATLYALNTAGGLLGAGLINQLIVPVLGIQRALLGLTLICTAIGLLALLAPARPARRWLSAGLATLLLALALGAALPSMMGRYAAKVASATGAAATEVKLIREGRAATVTVVDQMDPRLGSYRDIYLNGVEEASTRYWHTQLFKLLGMLPTLVHESDSAKSVLVIAFGAGITAGSTLASPEVASLDVVDLNPDIAEINDLFTAVNGDVFHAERFRFHNDDGRNFLATSRDRYDLIISDSTHPRAYDSWILYTEEFYRSVAQRLAPDGVFAQWVPVLGSMRGELFRIHLNTFRSVFPTATLWYVYGSDQAFLLATPRPFQLDVERLTAKLEQLPDWFRADEYQIASVDELAGFFWLDAAGMARMIGAEQRINTDDVHYFDKQSAVRPAPPALQLPRFQCSALPHLRGASEAQLTAIRLRQRLAGHLANFAFYGSKADLYSAYCLLPAEGNVQFWMNREFAENPPAPETFCREREIADYRALLKSHPENFLALNALADLLGQAGRLAEALPLAEEAARLAPDNGMVLDTKGWLHFQRGDLAQAIAALARADAKLPDHPIVLYHLGAARLAAGERAAGRRLLERALALAADFEGAADARRLLAGDTDR